MYNVQCTLHQKVVREVSTEERHEEYLLSVDMFLDMIYYNRVFYFFRRSTVF